MLGDLQIHHMDHVDTRRVRAKDVAFKPILKGRIKV
jgi:hypothetical protein